MWGDTWGYIHHLFWEQVINMAFFVFKTVRSFLNFQWLKSKSWKIRRFFPKFCHTFVPASDAPFFLGSYKNSPKSSQQAMRARSSHAFNQIFAEKMANTNSPTKMRPPNSQNAHILDPRHPKTYWEGTCNPQNIPKNTFSAGIWMYRVRLVFLVLTHLRPDVVMLLQVTKVSPSSETVITWRQQWPQEA